MLEGDRREWQRTSNDEGALLRGTRLDEAENWLMRRGDDLLPDDREFVEASVHARKRERASRHGWVLATVVAVAAIYTASAQILNLEDGWWSIATPTLTQILNLEDGWWSIATPTLTQILNLEDGWWSIAMPTLLALLAGLLAYTLRLRRQRQRIQRALGYYVPRPVAEAFAAPATEPTYATCLAADAEGFTAATEGMMPEAAASFLNTYFETLAEPLKRHGAGLTQFQADSIMCAWTGPRPDPTMRSKACLAAVEALEAVRSLNERYAPLHLGVRFGLHTGRVFVGHAGGGGQFNYGILGDIADTASRIEQLNKQLGTRLLATEDVVAGLDNILVRPLGDFTFAGKRSHVSVFEILSATGSATMAQLSLCGRFRLAIDAFRGERWDEAEFRFREILRDYPDDGPARFYLDQLHPEARRRAAVEAGDAS